MDTLIKREKIFDNIIVPSGTKKEAIKIISRLCATHRLLDESTLEEDFGRERNGILRDVETELQFRMHL